MNSECALTLKLSLLDTDVWREVKVPGNLTLAKLHKVIQTTFAWEDGHLHEFRSGREKVRETTEVGSLLPRKGSKFGYLYDFGDCWEVEVKRQGDEPLGPEPLPRCTGGQLAGPPEDCGGTGGYHELVQVKAKKRPDAADADLLEWAGDWDPLAFDLDEVNRKLARQFKTKAAKTPPAGQFTEKQGQYLAFIFWSTRINRQPPAQTDIQRFFGVTGPAVASMIATLESQGLLQRDAGKARSIKVLVDESKLPPLQEPGTPMIPVGRTWVRL